MHNPGEISLCKLNEKWLTNDLVNSLFYHHHFFFFFWRVAAEKELFWFYCQALKSISAAITPGGIQRLMASLCPCTGGEVRCCHQRRWTVSTLFSIDQGSNSICPLYPAIYLAGIWAEWQRIQYLTEWGGVCHQHSIQHICTAAVPGWLVTHHSWKENAGQVSCVPAICH